MNLPDHHTAQRAATAARLALRPWRRHSLVVGTVGLGVAVLGALWAYVVPVTPDRRQGLIAAFEVERVLGLAPMHLWGPVWIGVGLLAFVSTRWPPANEVWGYIAVAFLLASWGGWYLVGMVFWEAPRSGLPAMVVWWIFAFMVWGISGLRNPDDVVLIDRDARHRGALGTP